MTKVAGDPSTWRLETLHGPVDATWGGGRVRSSGPGVPEVVIPLRVLPSVPQLSGGIEGRIGREPVRIRRPRYGFRRRDRTVLLEGPGISWCSAFSSPSHWSLLRRRDGSVVLTVDGRRRHIDPEARPTEVSLAVAVLRARIVETSSLRAYVSP